MAFLYNSELYADRDLAEGVDAALMELLLAGLRDASSNRLAAGAGGELDGDDPCNIVNRTLPVGAPAAPARRAAGAQHAAAGGEVHRAQPPAAQAHHHPAVLDLRGGVPRRARPAPSRADRPHAQLPMSRQLTLLNALS